MKKAFVLFMMCFFISSCSTIQLPKNYDPKSKEVKLLSAKIIQARSEKSYTSTTFANLLVISEQELKDIESGKYPPDVYLFEKISRYTGKPMEWFFRE